jgi:hypothetical protein
MKLTWIINGQAHELEHPAAMAAGDAMVDVARATHQMAGVEWELRDERGFLFHADKPLADRASEGDRVYMSPRAGAGG